MSDHNRAPSAQMRSFILSSFFVHVSIIQDGSMFGRDHRSPAAGTSAAVNAPHAMLGHQPTLIPSQHHSPGSSSGTHPANFMPPSLPSPGGLQRSQQLPVIFFRSCFSSIQHFFYFALQYFAPPRDFLNEVFFFSL